MTKFVLQITISDEPIPTGHQSVCSIVRRGILFILRYGGSPYKWGERKPEALLDILKYGKYFLYRYLA